MVGQQVRERNKQRCNEELVWRDVVDWEGCLHDSCSVDDRPLKNVSPPKR